MTAPGSSKPESEQPITTGCTCDFSGGTRGMDRCGRCDGTGSRLVIKVDGQAVFFPNTKKGHDRAMARLAEAR